MNNTQKSNNTIYNRKYFLQIIMTNKYMDADFFGYIVIALVLLICLKIYYESDAFNLKCIISSVDGNRYCVREREKMEMAADLLAKVTKK